VYDNEIGGTHPGSQHRHLGSRAYRGDTRKALTDNRSGRAFASPDQLSLVGQVHPRIPSWQHRSANGVSHRLPKVCSNPSVLSTACSNKWAVSSQRTRNGPHSLSTGAGGRREPPSMAKGCCSVPGRSTSRSRGL